jgi:SAM domain (Sterile alpha motif)
MQQIADWLEKLGMSEYAERFAENRIDLSVLPDLTDQDLEKLGVLLGDRRKMLRAIVNLEATEKSAPAITVAATASAVPIGLRDTAERRQVTVIFRDFRCVPEADISFMRGVGRKGLGTDSCTATCMIILPVILFQGCNWNSTNSVVRMSAPVDCTTFFTIARTVGAYQYIT